MNINYSFIIPHKNCPELLQRCIDSIPERDDIQVIVVDDNSDEDKKPDLRSHKNLQVILLDATRSKGAGRARNVGLDHAIGKWLVFADSDDFFVTNLSELLDKYVNDSHDIIYFNIKACDCNDISVIHEGSNKSKIFRMYNKTGCDLYFRICYAEPWGKFIKRQVVIENSTRFQETMANNDLYFSVSTAILAGEILAVDAPLYWYTFRKGSIRHSKETYEKMCDRIRAWHSTHLFLKEHGIELKMYLPYKPCAVELIHKGKVRLYLRLLNFMRKNGMNYMGVVHGTIIWFFYKLCGQTERICFENLIPCKAPKGNK